MSYKVFLVEDEIITRQGIRDNVDWEAAGFEFCGEAPDGEMALPLIEEVKPDVLISDIKMPFMDGLQLSKIIREHMPWVKIVILSGHDEFNFAQSAVKLGVTDYLLKPVSSQDLFKVLGGLKVQLDQERSEREKLKDLQDKANHNFLLNREKFLLKLVMGGISTSEAVEQGQQLGLDIVAKYYQILFIRIEICEEYQPFDYQECQQIEQRVKQLLVNFQDVFLTKKDIEEIVILIKGDNLEQITNDGIFLAGLIEKELDNLTSCNIVVKIGSPQNRVGDIHRSFAEAMVRSKSSTPVPVENEIEDRQVELEDLDHRAVNDYLKFGSMQDFDTFFSTTIQPIAQISLHSTLVKHYLFVDIILTISQFISELGGKVEGMALNVYEIEHVLSDFLTIDQIKQEMKKIFAYAISYRLNQPNHERMLILQKAKRYIDDHLYDPDFQMSAVAREISLSPSYFSSIFRQEMGLAFRDYLSISRINRAKELLSTTSLQVAEIGTQCGFKDSHYFSYVFKKKTGKTPLQFRNQFHNLEQVE